MPYSEKKYKQHITLGQGDNTLTRLIVICIVIFVGLAFMKAVWYFTYQKDLALPLFNKNVLGLFIMPADIDKLLSRPWTIITHMFVHDNVWAVFANMLWLWSFGYIMQDLTGNSKIIPLFIYGALAGAGLLTPSAKAYSARGVDRKLTSKACSRHHSSKAAGFWFCSPVGISSLAPTHSADQTSHVDASKASPETQLETLEALTQKLPMCQ